MGKNMSKSRQSNNLRKTTPMPGPHLPTHIQSAGIRVVKSTASAAQCITKYIINGRHDASFRSFYLSYFFTTRTVLRKGARTYSNFYESSGAPILPLLMYDRWLPCIKK